MKAILFKDGVEIRRVNDYLKVDTGMNLVNMPAGYEWKLLVEGVKPPVSEIENLSHTEVDNNTSNADYPHLKQIDVVYTVERKPDAELNQSIENAENNANEQLINYTDRLKVMMLYMAIVHRKLNGDTITAKMQAILDKGDNYALKLWQNDTELEAKLQQVVNGEDVDINSNWTNG